MVDARSSRNTVPGLYVHWGGQRPMILSGALSTAAGTTFILQAGQDDTGLSTPVGYATAGGIFFLVSAPRLGHTAKNPDA